MEKREIEVMWNFYYGMGKSLTIWENELSLLDKNNVIRKIYEIEDTDFNEYWYLIRDNKEKSYILKNKKGDQYSKNIMQKYEKKYKFFKITTEVIKIYEDGLFPIVFKISDSYFKEVYDENKNISKAFFNNYYAKVKDEFYCVRFFRNKIEKETFVKEDDAIYWCSDFNITKDEVLNNNIRPLNLRKRVYLYNNGGE